MKLPVSWLKKYIEVKLPAQKLADKLTLSGTKVEEVLDSSGDGAVIDIEVTSNRPDCLSVMGLAVEVAAITGKKAHFPKAYSVPEKPARPRANTAVSIHIEDKKGCNRYTARILKNVQVRPSPAEAQRLLTLAGTRAISNVVDATNYVLYECGQPMHAFDLDKIHGEHIDVRRSKKGEKFLGIDGIEYTLDEKTLVIADAERVIAIAGVMGGKLAEVTDSTKNILLESAYFDPGSVRQASKKYKISTESSYRFERGVNPEHIARASKRCAELIHEWAGGEDVSGLLDKNFSPKKNEKPIRLRMDRLEEAIGLRLSQARVVSILKSLSFSVKRSGKDSLWVKPCAGRRDVAQEVDLFEEVLRIEGFERVGHRIPATHYSEEPVRDAKATGLLKLKRYMASIGFDEIMTFSLLSGKKLEQAGFSLSQAHRLVNTTSAEQEYFRPSLLPGMLEAVLFNVHRKASSLKLFEVGNRLIGGREETVLAACLYGAADENWAKKSSTSFYDLKGALENILDRFGVRGAQWQTAGSDSRFSAIADVREEAGSLGFCGEVASALVQRWDIPHALYYGEILLENLFERTPSWTRIRPVPRYPAVRRDIAFIIDNRVSVKDLEAAMRNASSPYLQSVNLFDQFMGKNVPDGKRSLAFSLSYQKEDGTFTDEEIQNLQKKVGDNLKRLYQVEFR